MTENKKIFDQNPQINEGRFQFKPLCLTAYCNIFFLILEYYFFFLFSFSVSQELYQEYPSSGMLKIQRKSWKPTQKNSIKKTAFPLTISWKRKLN